MIAEVIINTNAKKLNRTFDYKVPEELKDEIMIGSKVLVSFGNKKELEEGFVVGFKEKTEYKVKEIAKLEDKLSDKQIELAKWMAKRYFCNISDCIKLMQTPGTRTKNKEKRIQDKTINAVYLKKEYQEIEFEIETNQIKSEKHIKILKFVKDNEGATIPEIEMFTNCSRAIINTLIKNNYLEIIEQKIERDPLANKKIEKTTKLELTQEQKTAYEKVEKSIEENRYEKFLLFGVTGSGKTEIYLQLIEKVLEKDKKAIMLVPEISLTPQMIERFIARFGKEKIAVLHSKLSIGERHDEWNKIKENKANIIIGARSAIFAPMQNLGIIIIDEEHDSSYKSEATPKYNAKEIAEKIAKEEKIPLLLGSATPDIVTYFETEKTKEEKNEKEEEKTEKKEEEKLENNENEEERLANTENIENEEEKLANTENIENVAKEKQKTTKLVLTKRANDSKLPKIEIIDLKQELANGNRSMLSLELYNSIEENLKNEYQTILFLNRRGYSTFIMCRECGYTVKCKNCNISMTYHSYEKKLKCHYCGYEEPLVTICPQCGSKKIRYFGTGTQKLEEEIHRQFPNAKTIRMDIDTVTKKNSHEQILNDFKNNGIDILIGTQMVVKGHHFPKVTLVGVIAADSSLNIDDYRANEKTFQILTQVAGRAGREKLPGKVVIQTYNPENFSIQTAQKQNYQEFYETELALRKQLKYPPFCDIIVIGFNSSKEEKIKQISEQIYKELKNKLNKEEYSIFNPAPSPIDKIQNRFRWRIIIKGKMKEETNEILNEELRKIYEKNDRSVNISIDVNPNNMI